MAFRGSPAAWFSVRDGSASRTPIFQSPQVQAGEGGELDRTHRGLEEPDRLAPRDVVWRLLGGEYYRCGSTYEWKDLSTEPTAGAREEDPFSSGTVLESQS